MKLYWGVPGGKTNVIRFWWLSGSLCLPPYWKSGHYTTSYEWIFLKFSNISAMMQFIKQFFEQLITFWTWSGSPCWLSKSRIQVVWGQWAALTKKICALWVFSSCKNYVIDSTPMCTIIGWSCVGVMTIKVFHFIHKLMFDIQMGEHSNFFHRASTLPVMISPHAHCPPQA